MTSDNIAVATSVIAIVLSVANLLVEWWRNRPLSLKGQRQRQEERMRDACDICVPPQGSWKHLEEWPIAHRTTCFVGLPTPREVQRVSVVGEERRVLMTSFGVCGTPDPELLWPISLPHGTSVRAGDHVVIHFPGADRRYRVVSVYGPYTDEVSCDVVGLMIKD